MVNRKERCSEGDEEPASVEEEEPSSETRDGGSNAPDGHKEPPDQGGEELLVNNHSRPSDLRRRYRGRREGNEGGSLGDVGVVDAGDGRSRRGRNRLEGDGRERTEGGTSPRRETRMKRAEGQRVAEQHECEEPTEDDPNKYGGLYLQTILGIFLVVFIFCVSYLKYLEEIYNTSIDSNVNPSSMVNYYSLLELSSEGATSQEIKKKYRKLSLLWHPDRNPNCEKCEDKFRELTLAYETLLNEDRRLNYNQGMSGRLFKGVVPSDTPSLTYARYQQEVLASRQVWVIQVYSDRNEVAKRIAPVWESTAKRFDGPVKFGRVEVHHHSDTLTLMPTKIREPRKRPTIIMVTNYKMINIFPGVPSISERRFKKWIVESFPSNQTMTQLEDEDHLYRWLASSDQPKILISAWRPPQTFRGKDWNEMDFWERRKARQKSRTNKNEERLTFARPWLTEMAVAFKWRSVFDIATVSSAKLPPNLSSINTTNTRGSSVHFAHRFLEDEPEEEFGVPVEDSNHPKPCRGQQCDGEDTHDVFDELDEFNGDQASPHRSFDPRFAEFKIDDVSSVFIFQAPPIIRAREIAFKEKYGITMPVAVVKNFKKSTTRPRAASRVYQLERAFTDALKFTAPFLDKTNSDLLCQSNSSVGERVFCLVLIDLPLVVNAHRQSTYNSTTSHDRANDFTMGVSEILHSLTHENGTQHEVKKVLSSLGSTARLHVVRLTSRYRDYEFIESDRFVNEPPLSILRSMGLDMPLPVPEQFLKIWDNLLNGDSAFWLDLEGARLGRGAERVASTNDLRNLLHLLEDEKWVQFSALTVDASETHRAHPCTLASEANEDGAAAQLPSQCPCGGTTSEFVTGCLPHKSTGRHAFVSIATKLSLKEILIAILLIGLGNVLYNWAGGYRAVIVGLIIIPSLVNFCFRFYTSRFGISILERLRAIMAIKIT
eukprot:GHVN01053023.1.p1 GENE.GHVN01053023.1~~GHVN01053023.1.p1  ORF type:complete len:940 (+),score=118.38 GHVN01053023.1:1508-4327(+)